eukprot:5764859-Alexandrium_andersonii.AAC.1
MCALIALPKGTLGTLVRTSRSLRCCSTCCHAVGHCPMTSPWRTHSQLRSELVHQSRSTARTFCAA